MAKKSKPKKLLTRTDVKAITSELGVLIQGLRNGIEAGHKVNVNDRDLLTMLEKSRRAIIQLERPRRDYS